MGVVISLGLYVGVGLMFCLLIAGPDLGGLWLVSLVLGWPLFLAMGFLLLIALASLMVVIIGWMFDD